MNFVNKYPDGRIDLFLDNVSISLYPDNHISYNYWSEDEGLPDFSFDLLSEVGEKWKRGVLWLIEYYEIKLDKFDNETEFCDKWISCNVEPYEEHNG